MEMVFVASVWYSAKHVLAQRPTIHYSFTISRVAEMCQLRGVSPKCRTTHIRLSNKQHRRLCFIFAEIPSWEDMGGEDGLRSRWRCFFPTFRSKFNGTSIEWAKSLLRVYYVNLFDFPREEEKNTNKKFTFILYSEHLRCMFMYYCFFSHWRRMIRMNLNAIVILIVCVDWKWLAHEMFAFVTIWWHQTNNRRMFQRTKCSVNDS